jgi:hypothetical protein
MINGYLVDFEFVFSNLGNSKTAKQGDLTKISQTKSCTKSFLVR